MAGIDAKNIIVNLSVTGNYAAGMARAGAATQTFGNQANAGMMKAQSGMAKWGATAAKVGKFSALIIAAGLVLAAKAAIDFESSFAGVRKTVDATEPQFRRLADGIREMAKEIPVGVNELNRIAELGGQLGVEVDGLLEFTETIAMIGVTTTLSTEEAALGFARLDNIMGLNEGSFDRIGSTIVDLGNNFAATEDEILAFSLRVAPVGATLGLTTDEVLALATAFTSVGIPAERGGTAVQKSFIKMADAVDVGGEKLDVFAQTAGMASEEFASLFRSDPSQAFSAFVTGLGEVAEAGDSTFAVLRAVGLSDQRVMGALLGMANASGTLTDALNAGEQAWKDNTALVDEAEKRFETTASQLLILKATVVDFGIGLGSEVLPFLNDFIGGLGQVFEWISNLNPLIKGATGLVLGLSAAFFLASSHPIIAALTLVAGVITKIGFDARKAEERVDSLKETLSGIDITKDALNAQIGSDNVDDFLSLGFTVDEIGDAIFGTQEDYDEFVRKTRGRLIAAGHEVGVIATDAFGEGAELDPLFFGSEGSGLREIQKRRDEVVGLIRDEQELIAARNRAVILGSDVFGDPTEAADKGRAAVEALMHARQGLAAQDAIELQPAVITDEALDAIDSALTDYSTTVDEAFADVDASIRDQIDLWYEFDDELDVAFDDIIETFTRQLNAIGSFEEVLSGLALRDDVEVLIRDTFNTPVLKEAFNEFATTGGELFDDWLASLTSQADRIVDIVQEKWERLNAPIEFKTGEQFLADIKAAADEMINDPNNTYDPAAIWLGIINSTIETATPEMRSKILNLLSESFADDGTLTQNVDLIRGQIDILREALAELEGTYRVNVEFNTFGDIGPPPGTGPTGGSSGSSGSSGSGSSNLDPEFRAFGGNVFKDKSYFVGEDGVELFTPLLSGTITSNNDLQSLSGGNQTTVNIYRVETDDLPGDLSEGLTRASIVEQIDLIGAF